MQTLPSFLAREIALTAQVSEPTVQRVVSGKQRTRPGTRARVLRALRVHEQAILQAIDDERRIGAEPRP